MSLITLNYQEIINNKVEHKTLEFSQSLLDDNINANNLFVTKLDGESMQPVVKDKSLVVIDLSQKELEEEGIYMVQHEEAMWLKIAIKEDGEFLFSSINEAYKHKRFLLKDVHIFGKACLTFTKL